MSDAPPEPPPEPPPAEPPPPPEPPPAAEPEPNEGGNGDEGTEGREAKARREARNLRAQLKAEREGKTESVAKAVEEATADLTDRVAELEGQLAERDVQLKAVGKLRNPADAIRFIDVANTPAEDIDAAIAAVLKERPYLGVVDGQHALPQGAQTNGRDAAAAADASSWLRDQIIKR